MELVDILLNERVNITLASDDLREFATILANNILSDRREMKETISDQPIPQAEALKRWNKSRQTFVNWRKKGLVTAYTINGRIYYKPSEIMAALQKKL